MPARPCRAACAAINPELIMKSKILSLCLMLWCSLTVWGQQQQSQLRSVSPFHFEEFQDAKVLQPFGRYIKTRANIFLKDGTLLFIQDNNILQANVQNVLGVAFDTVLFLKVNDNQMGRVVHEKNYNYLLCVTTIDMEKLGAEQSGSEDPDFLEIPDAGVFINIENESFKRDEDKGYPLKKKYYFKIRDKVIPANESHFKKVVRTDKKKEFKALMNNKRWSWWDETSLIQLFDYISLN